MKVHGFLILVAVFNHKDFAPGSSRKVHKYEDYERKKPNFMLWGSLLIIPYFAENFCYELVGYFI